MTDRKPKHIVCAVRGGRESRNTVTHAVDLAIEHGARLTFFHVLDAEFLGAASLTMAPVRAVYQQLHEMGEFAMLILCDRASRRGISEVDFQVREGNIQKQLHQMALESQADILVMGRPVRSPGSNIFTADTVHQFVGEVEQASGLQVIIVTPEATEYTDNTSAPGVLPP